MCRRSANIEVQKAVVENEMATARDKALDLYNAGKAKEAAENLRQTSQTLQEKSSQLGLQQLSNEAAGLDKDAARFEAEEVDTRLKKELRSTATESEASSSRWACRAEKKADEANLAPRGSLAPAPRPHPRCGVGAMALLGREQEASPGPRGRPQRTGPRQRPVPSSSASLESRPS